MPCPMLEPALHFAGSSVSWLELWAFALALGGVVLTATRIVNAIPAVCAAAPGQLSALDLPMITGRGLMAR